MNKLENSSIGVNILVNGKPVKQYTSEGKLFIEAKSDTEYQIEVKNNRPTRILAIIGVDQVNVLDGQPNTPKSPGYVINGYESLKLKGYRVSDTEIVSFKFCKTGEGYAESKTVNAQTGVISVECIAEKVDTNFYKTLQEQFTKKEYVPYPVYPTWPTYNPPVWLATYPNSTPFYGAISGTYADTNVTYSCYNNSGLVGEVQAHNFVSRVSDAKLTQSAESTPSKHFDMSTAWGQIQESKVVDVEFEHGINLGKTMLYYASSQGLKELGINVTNEQKVVFPQGIHKNYCTPPPGWKI